MPDSIAAGCRLPLPGPLIVERMAGDADLDAVVALEGLSFTNPWTREMLARELTPPTCGRVYVLRLPGTPVAAFCACWVIADELHINTIAVAAELRRRGLARALMRHVLADVALDGVRRATLEVRRSNQAARRLYEGLGFRTAGVRQGYYTQPEEDALILWKETDPAAGGTGEAPEHPPRP